MKVLNFAVTVQHGVGHHYILRSDIETLQQAEELAERTMHDQVIAYDRTHKAKPSVHIWALHASIPFDTYIGMQEDNHA